MLVKDCTSFSSWVHQRATRTGEFPVQGACWHSQVCKQYFHPGKLAAEQESLRPKPSRTTPCTMHLMTAAILKNRMLTACSNLVLMISDLPVDLSLHQSHGSGLGLLGLQKDYSPKGSCSSLFSSAAAIRKTLGALPAWREGLSPLQVQLFLDRNQHSITAPQHHQPPQPSGPSWGDTPQLWGRASQLSEDLLQGPFPCPLQVGVALRNGVCVLGGLGDALAPKSQLNCVLHGPWMGLLMLAFKRLVNQTVFWKKTWTTNPHYF